MFTGSERRDMNRRRQGIEAKRRVVLAQKAVVDMLQEGGIMPEDSLESFLGAPTSWYRQY